LVEIGKGYGYGDDLQVQRETRLPTGEVFKVLTWEERLEMEQEVGYDKSRCWAICILIHSIL
jgi:hypothetical protein